MKILFYINQIYEGGAERVITQLASSFAEAGDEAVLVTSFEHGGEYVFSDKVVRLSLEKEQLRQSRIKRNASRISKLRKIVKAQRPDIVLSFMQEPNFRALIACVGLDCKNVVSVRNDPSREYSGLLGIVVGKILIPLLTDHCVFQTEQARDWFPVTLRRKSSVICNEVAPEFFLNRKNDSDEYWMAAGRLVEQKNYPMMLKAFKLVLRDCPNEALKIFGEGVEGAFLSDLVFRMNLQDNVFLMGQASDMADKMRCAKGFLLSSDYEGMPNALLEAMAIGLPCISTDCPCGGPREMIESGYTGFLVPVGSYDSMAKCMMQVALDKKLAADLGQHAAEKAMDYYPAAVFKRWKDCFISILGGKNPGSY